MSDRDTINQLLLRWPQTAHLSALIKSVAIELPDGSVDTALPTTEIIAVFEEFIRISDAMRHPPRDMRAVAARMHRMLPGIRAFDADPHSVMRNGVN